MPDKLLRILLVEDDPSHAKAIVGAFKSEDNVQLTIASSIREARHRLIEIAVDLVVTEWLLPDGKGVELLPGEQNTYGYPVLVLIDRGNETVAIEAMKSGALDYVVKSQESLDQMPHTVRRALREWNLLVERKNHLEQISRAKIEWDLTFDTIPDLVAIIDNQHRIVRINKAMADQLDITMEEAVGTKCYKVVHNLDAPMEDCPHILTLSDGKEHVAEIVEERLGGTFAISATPIIGNNGELQGCVHFARDITAHKQVEAELQQSERKYRSLVETMNDGLTVLDETGRIAYTNKQFASMLGLTPEEVIGTAPRYYQDKESKQIFDKYYERRKEGHSDRYATTLTAVDGRKTPVIVSASPLLSEDGIFKGALAVITDITHLKETEKALQESEIKFISAFESSGLGMALLTPDGRFMSVNRSASRILGYTASEFLDLDIPTLTYPDDREESEDLYNALIAGRFDSFRQEKRFVHKDGHTIWGITDISAVRNSSGNVLFSIALLNDITERKKVEEALRKSESGLAKAQELAHLGNWEWDINAGTVTISAEMGRIWGLSPEERIVGYEKIIDVIHPDDRENVEKALNDAVQGLTPYNMEFRITRPDGTARYILGQAQMLRDDLDCKVKLIGTGMDITELKEAEEAIRNSEAFLNSLIEQSPIAMWVSDENGTLIRLNQACRDALRVSDEEVVGKYNIFYDNNLKDQGLIPVVESVYREGKTVNFQLTYDSTRAKGLELERTVCIIIDVTIFPVKSPEGKVTNAVIQHFDITAQKRAEEALKESEERYRQLADVTFEAILFHDKGLLISANDLFYQMMGYTPEELIGKDILESTLNPESRDMVKKRIQAGISDPCEAVCMRKDRTTFPVEIRVRLVEIGGKEIRAVAIRDISERKEMESQLLEAQKMKAVGTLAGGISHDFNNLLQIVLGHSDFLLLEKPETAADYQELKAIKDAAERGADLVRQILTYSRKVESKREKVNPNDDVRRVERLLYRTIPKMIEIELDLANDLMPVRADTTQIEQMLLNLAVNSKDAMPDGGKLMFKTSNVIVDENSLDLGRKLKHGKYVLLEVADTGFGMDKDVLERVFEPFFTTKPMGDGTGLGLSMVFGIVKMHDGHITCQSEPNSGTTFRIYLPVAEYHANDRIASKLPIPAGGTENILVVDDEPLIQELANKVLENAGYSVMMAGSAQEAIEIYKKQKESISLIILDLIMPGISGKQCLEQVLSINPQAKVLIASGFAVDQDTREYLASAAKGIVSKPFNMRELLGSVRSVLDGI